MDLQSHRAGRIWTRAALEELAWIEANTVEGERVFLLPDKAGLYFLSRTKNVTSYPILLDQEFFTGQQIDEARRQIEDRCAAVGVWDRTRLASGMTVRPDWFTLEPVYRSLMRDYATVATFADGAVGLRRKTPCANSAVIEPL
jgi:hypothetical protein